MKRQVPANIGLPGEQELEHPYLKKMDKGAFFNICQQEADSISNDSYSSDRHNFDDNDSENYFAGDRLSVGKSYPNIKTEHSENYLQQYIYLNEYSNLDNSHQAIGQHPNHRKIRRRRWMQRDMTKAYNAVKHRGMSLRGAASTFNVPESTLRDRIHGRVSLDCSRPGPPTFFTQEEEKKMVDHILFMSKIGYPYTRSQVVELAGDMTKAVGRIAPFKYLNPSQAWFYAFLNRWPDLRNYLFGPRSHRKSKGITKDALHAYFEQLDKVMTKACVKDKPENIWTLDEVCVCTDTQPTRVLPIGIQRAQSMSYWSPSVAMLGAGNAAGRRIPPFMVYKGDGPITYKQMEGAVRGTKFCSSLNGWINSDVFIQWFSKHFKLAVSERPIILLYDGHLQFVSVRVLERAKDEGVLLFPLPPHPAYNQCVENTCFWNFSKYFKRRLDRHYEDPDHVPITKDNACQLLCYSHENTMQPPHLIQLFERIGIYPFNKTANISGYQQVQTKCDNNSVSNVQPIEPIDPRSCSYPVDHLLPYTKRPVLMSNVPALTASQKMFMKLKAENRSLEQNHDPDCNRQIVDESSELIDGSGSTQMSRPVILPAYYDKYIPAEVKDTMSCGVGMLRLQGPGASSNIDSLSKQFSASTSKAGDFLGGSRCSSQDNSSINEVEEPTNDADVEYVGENLQTILKKQLKTELMDDFDFDLIPLNPSDPSVASDLEHLMAFETSSNAVISTDDNRTQCSSQASDEMVTRSSSASNKNVISSKTEPVDPCLYEEEEEDCDIHEVCAVCRMMEPPDCDSLMSQCNQDGSFNEELVVDWTKCDFCNKWVHLTGGCCDESCVLPDNSFMCVVCQRTKKLK